MNIYNKYLIAQCNSNILLKFLKLFKIFLDCCFLDLLWIHFLIKMLSAQMYAWYMVLSGVDKCTFIMVHKLHQLQYLK